LLLLIASDAVVIRRHHDSDYPSEDNAPYRAFNQGSNGTDWRFGEQGDPAVRGAFKPWQYGCDQPAEDEQNNKRGRGGDAKGTKMYWRKLWTWRKSCHGNLPLNAPSCLCRMKRSLRQIKFKPL